MPTVCIFHGVGGYPEENWYPWLASALRDIGCSVLVPQFPHADTPDLSEWMKHAETLLPSLGSDTTIIGHSLGAAFALRFLEKHEIRIRSLILVAPVWEVMENAFDPHMTSFTESPYDWGSIRARADTMKIIASDNDPYIALAKSKALAAHLGVPLEIFTGAGHFNTASGYTTFPFLADLCAKED